MSGALYQLFTQWLEHAPQRLWLYYRDQCVTYKDIDDQVDRLASQLLEQGLESGDRVALYMAKSPGLVVALLACSRLGLVAVPIHTVLKKPQLNHIVNDCSAKALLTDDRRRDYLSSGLLAPALSRLFCYRESDANDFSCYALDAGQSAELLPKRFAEAELIIYTSGSTGKPKGVVVSTNNLKQGALSVAQYLALTDSDRILALLPFAFDYGFNQLSSALVSGAGLVLMDFLLAGDVVRQVKAWEITVIAGVPPLWFKLLDADWSDGTGDSVRLLTNSGGRLPVVKQQELLDCFKRAELVLMYGLTEAFRSSYLPATLRESHPNSIGKAIPGAELFIVNERGESAAVGEEGELVHCGPLVTLGYWGEETLSDIRYRLPPDQAKLVSETGKAVWSGDRVYQDDQGLLYFVGREDGLIKSSGYRISPEEVEEVAYTLEGIEEAVAIGIDDEALGQRLVLVVVTGNSNQTEAEVCQEMRRVLPEYMVPTQVVFRDELPRTASGKFDRVAIKAQML